MKSMGLRGKLAFLVVVQILIALTVGFIGYVTSHETQSIYGEVMESNVPKIRTLNRMLLSFRYARIELLHLVAPNTPPEMDQEALRAIAEQWEAYARDEKLYESLPQTPGEAAMFDDFQKSVAITHKMMDDAIALYRKNPDDDSAERKAMSKIALSDIPATSVKVRELTANLIKAQAEAMDSRSADAKGTANRGNLFTLVAVLIGSLVGAAIGFVFSRQLSASLTKVSEALASGAAEVSHALNDLTKASESLSSSATEQAASLQETSASVEEISAMVRQSSDGAKESATASDLSKSRAEHGKSVVETMIASMGEIDQSNQTIFSEFTESNDRIADIMQLIQEIGNKTKVINDIVFQTKLLSFNASVEAARAGEHGKGFAVVAEEVGNLAQMSGNAAKEITNLLDSSIERVGSIVSETKSKVERLSRDVKVTVEKGGQVARDCGEVLDEIVTHAGTVSAMVQSIAQSSHEQANGVTEIAKAVQQLDLVTHSNSSAANQTAAAAGQLAEQARALKESSDVLRGIILGAGAAAKNSSVAAPKAPSVPGSQGGKRRPVSDHSGSVEPAAKRRAA